MLCIASLTFLTKVCLMVQIKLLSFIVDIVPCFQVDPPLTFWSCLPDIMWSLFYSAGSTESTTPPSSLKQVLCIDTLPPLPV